MYKNIEPISKFKDEATIENVILDTNNIYQSTSGSEINLPEPIEVHLDSSLSSLIDSSFDELDINPIVNLRQGCYLLRYVPTSSSNPSLFIHYDGTLRVQLDGSNIISSGDLYLHRLMPSPFPTPTIASEPNPSRGIPIFKRANYRYYIRVTRISRAPGIVPRITIEFERYRFSSSSTWINEGRFRADMSRIPAPIGYPSSSDYYTGSVTDSLGTKLGDLTMGWISKFFRRATIEIDKVSASEWPLDNGSDVNWRNIFNLVGWDVTIIQSASSISEPSGEFWSDAELHNAMLSWRDSSDLDSEWLYHILCTRRLDSTERGIMYDNGGTDSNNIPREGASLSSHWVIPNADPWGLTKGLRFGTATGPYFRTAVHEIGHAMGLYHNTVDNGIMNATNIIASNAVFPIQFPNNIQWSHAPDDQRRLRHFPDNWVRPGGIPFGSSYPSVLPDDMVFDDEDLSLKVTPEEDAVPIGAPVRINYILKNNSNISKIVPKELSMKSGNISGKVIDPSGTTRTFLPIILCLDEEMTVELKPDKSITNSATLLRGAQGYLFPLPGVYKVIVEVSWEINGFRQRVNGTTNVMVTPPVDDEHAKAAYKIISNPDSLLVLVIGGDHLKEGIEAIKTGLENPVLKPHYSYIEAKRISRKFGKRKPSLKTASNLIDKKTIMSQEEVKKMAQIVKDERKNISEATLKDIKSNLKQKTGKSETDNEVRKLVESL